MFYTMETLLSNRSKDYFSVTASSKLRFQGSHSGETSNSTLYKKSKPACYFTVQSPSAQPEEGKVQRYNLRVTLTVKSL